MSANLERLKRTHALVQTRPDEALAELRTLEAEGDIACLAMIGGLYHRYLAEEKRDVSKAEEYYRRSYDAGMNEGLYSLGRLYFDQKKYGEAECVFLDGVSKNFLPAFFWLARLYDEMLSHAEQAVTKEKVVLAYENAARRGHLYAIRRLFDIYRNPWWGAPQYLKAIRTYIRMIAGIRVLFFCRHPDDRLR